MSYTFDYFLLFLCILTRILYIYIYRQKHYTNQNIHIVHGHQNFTKFFMTVQFPISYFYIYLLLFHVCCTDQIIGHRSQANLNGSLQNVVSELAMTCETVHHMQILMPNVADTTLISLKALINDSFYYYGFITLGKRACLRHYLHTKAKRQGRISVLVRYRIK